MYYLTENVIKECNCNESVNVDFQNLYHFIHRLDLIGKSMMDFHYHESE